LSQYVETMSDITKLTKDVFVLHPLGLHARSATLIAGLLQRGKSRATLQCNGKVADARSVVQLLMLGARKDAKVEITVEGEDAEDVMDRLVRAFDRGLEAG